MPTFREEVNIDEYVDVDLDIEVQEFYDEMNDAERKEMFDLLVKNGFAPSNIQSHLNWEFTNAIVKLSSNYFSLTNEEINTIIKLSKRF